MTIFQGAFDLNSLYLNSLKIALEHIVTFFWVGPSESVIFIGDFILKDAEKVGLDNYKQSLLII